jgi:hypothetical protein
MNEEALKEAHKYFSDNGYSGKINDFKNLLSTNKEAFGEAYKYFSDNGYNGDEKHFSTLMGVEPLKKKVQSESSLSNQILGSKDLSEPQIQPITPLTESGTKAQPIDIVDNRQVQSPQISATNQEIVGQSKDVPSYQKEPLADFAKGINTGVKANAQARKDAEALLGSGQTMPKYSKENSFLPLNKTLSKRIDEHNKVIDEQLNEKKARVQQYLNNQYKLYKENPTENEKSNWLGEMVGSVGEDILGAGAVSAIPVGGQAAALLGLATKQGLQGAGSGMRRGYFQALDEGKTPDEAYKIAQNLSVVDGLTNTVEGIFGAFTGNASSKILPQLKNPIKKAIAKINVDGVIDGGVAAIGQLARNLNDKYNELKRDLGEGIAESAFAEYLMGAGINTINELPTIAKEIQESKQQQNEGQQTNTNEVTAETGDNAIPTSVSNGQQAQVPTTEGEVQQVNPKIEELKTIIANNDGSTSGSKIILQRAKEELAKLEPQQAEQAIQEDVVDNNELTPEQQDSKNRVDEFINGLSETNPELHELALTDPISALNQLIEHHKKNLSGTNNATKAYSQKAIDKFEALKKDIELINKKPEQPLVSNEPVIDKPLESKPTEEVKVEEPVIEAPKEEIKPKYDAKNNLIGSEKYKTTNYKSSKPITKTVGGKKLKGRYRLVSANDILASHNEETFSKTNGFPVDENGNTINDRDYGKDKNAQYEVQKIAQNIDDRAINDTPVVTKDGIVVSGNNRTMSRKLSSKLGTDANYISSLKEMVNAGSLHGFTEQDVDSVENPMLVFEPEQDIEYNTKEMASFNKSGLKEQSPIGKAIALSKSVSDKTKRILSQIYENTKTQSEVTSSKKKVLEVKDLLLNEKIIGTEEIPKYFNLETGTMTPEGVALMDTFLLGTSLNENAIISLSSEGMGDVKNKVISILPQLTKNNSLGKNSLIPYVENAIQLINKAKKQNVSLLDLVNQIDIFEAVKYSPEDIAMAIVLTDAGTKKFFEDYNKNVDTEDAFDGKRTKEKEIDRYFKKNITDYETFRENLRSNEPITKGAVQENNGGIEQKKPITEPKEIKKESDTANEKIDAATNSIKEKLAAKEAKKQQALDKLEKGIEGLSNKLNVKKNAISEDPTSLNDDIQAIAQALFDLLEITGKELINAVKAKLKDFNLTEEEFKQYEPIINKIGQDESKGRVPNDNNNKSEGDSSNDTGKKSDSSGNGKTKSDSKGTDKQTNPIEDKGSNAAIRAMLDKHGIKNSYAKIEEKNSDTHDKAFETRQEWIKNGVYEKEINTIINNALKHEFDRLDYKSSIKDQAILIQHIFDLEDAHDSLLDVNSEAYKNNEKALALAEKANQIMGNSAGAGLQIRNARVTTIRNGADAIKAFENINSINVNNTKIEVKLTEEERVKANELGNNIKKAAEEETKAAKEIEDINEKEAELLEKEKENEELKKENEELKKLLADKSGKYEKKAAEIKAKKEKLQVSITDRLAKISSIAGDKIGVKLSAVPDVSNNKEQNKILRDEIKGLIFDVASLVNTEAESGILRGQKLIDKVKEYIDEKLGRKDIADNLDEYKDSITEAEMAFLKEELPNIKAKMREIAQANKGIALDELYAKTATEIPYLSKEDVKNILLGRLFGNTPKTTMSEAQVTLSNLKKEQILLDKIFKLQNGLETEKSPSKKSITNERIEALKKELDAVQKTLGVGKYAPKTEKPIADKFLTQLKQRAGANKKQIESIEAKIKNKQFEKAPKKPSVLDNVDLQKKYPEQYESYLKSKEAKTKAVAEFEIAKIEFDLERRNKYQKAADLAKDIITTAIDTGLSTKSMFDMGIIFNHLNIITLSNPVLVGRALIKGLTTNIANSREHKAFLNKLDTTYMGKLAKKYMPILEVGNADFSKTLEGFGGNKDLWKKEFTVNGKTYSIGQAIERFNAQVFNDIRFSLFEKEAQKLLDNGITPENNPKEFESLGRAISELTGQGKTAPVIQKNARLIGSMIWSPKLWASAANILGLGDAAILPTTIFPKYRNNRGFWGSMTPTARTFVAKELGKGLTAAALTMTALWLKDQDDFWFDFDPRSSTFGDYGYNSTGRSYNMFARMSSVVRMFAQMFPFEVSKNENDSSLSRMILYRNPAGQYTKREYGKETGGMIDWAYKNFLRSKVKPHVGTLLDFANNAGYDYYTSEKLTAKVLLEQQAPIGFRQIYQEMKKDIELQTALEVLAIITNFRAKDANSYNEIRVNKKVMNKTLNEEKKEREELNPEQTRKEKNEERIIDRIVKKIMR